MRWWDVTRRQNMILIAPARSLQSNLVLICRGHSSQSTNSGHSQIFKQVRKPSSSPWGSESFWISSLHYCFVKRKFSNCLPIYYKSYRLSVTVCLTLRFSRVAFRNYKVLSLQSPWEINWPKLILLLLSEVKENISPGRYKARWSSWVLCQTNMSGMTCFTWVSCFPC